MKFQPTPRRNSATRNCIRSTPESAIPTHASISTQPVAITSGMPEPRDQRAGEQAGANMPTMCHSITSAADANGCLQTSIASGVETISRFITP